MSVASTVDETNETGLGHQIRSIRKLRGLSVEKAAELAGITTSGLSLIERGKRSPNVESMTGIALALGIVFTINGAGVTIGITILSSDVSPV